VTRAGTKRTGSTAPSPARAVAAHVLERVARDDAYADLVLDAALAARPLAPRDSALATEVAFGALRWQRYLDWILAPHSRRRLESLDPGVLAVLRMSAYQIVFLERVPAFAIVNDAVTLAGSRPGVAGFVNAVLRSFARRGVHEREPTAPRDPIDALATRCSFPTWLAVRWVTRYGIGEAAALMKALDERPPVTLRVNTLRTTRDALLARLATDEGRVAAATPYAPEGVIVDHGATKPGATKPGGGPPASWRAFDEGDFAVQDEASMLVARLLGPVPGDLVVDACAAPGTKTTHLAQLMENRGRVIAFDPNAARLGRVGEAAARLGVSIIETRAETVEAQAPALPGACNGVLVDAPCTALGILRRHPEIKWRRKPADIATSAARQREILTAAATMVKPGGRLVYATCSLEPEENDDVIRAFLAERADFAVDAPAGFPLPLDAGGVLRCVPSRHGTDGFTAVRVRRAL
jgi:16S rRNA (cytosine967-C5)-methyltransferase